MAGWRPAWLRHGWSPPHQTDDGRAGLAGARALQVLRDPDGRGKAPIVVSYEHQYLDYQLQHTASKGTPDTDRVLLYPRQQMLTDPRFIAISPSADVLARKMEENVGLRRRLMELGYRVIDSEGITDSRQLGRYLHDRGVPAPDRSTDYTTAAMPTSQVLEKLIGQVATCAGP